MPKVGVFAFSFVLMLIGFGAGSAEAQAPINSDAIEAANAAAGTARVLATHLTPGDSLIVSVLDDQLTSEALMAGAWRLGGREEVSRTVGRAIADAIRSGLPAESSVRIIVVDVVGPSTAPFEDSGLSRPTSPRVRFFYPLADRPSR